MVAREGARNVDLAAAACQRNLPLYAAATAACFHVDLEPIFSVRELWLMHDDARCLTFRIGEHGLAYDIAIGSDVLQANFGDVRRCRTRGRVRLSERSGTARRRA